MTMRADSTRCCGEVVSEHEKDGCVCESTAYPNMIENIIVAHGQQGIAGECRTHRGERLR